MSKRNSVVKSFGYAGSGIKKAFIDGPNFRIHVIVGTLALILAVYFKFTLEKFAVLILTILFVIFLELINTVVEEIVNILRPRYSPKAKLIKDLSAGIVLIAAFAAILVGLVLFLPDILPLLSSVIH